MDILNIASKFQIKGDILGYIPLGNGHINTTYLITTSSNNRYVLQKINHSVFKSVDALMSNMFLVTNFLKSINEETISIIPTKDHKLFTKIEDEYYRVFAFIEGAVCYEKVKNSEMLTKLAKAFGTLHRDLFRFDASKLVEVIPNFHNTYQRYLNLLDAVNLNPLNRKCECLRELQDIEKYRDMYSFLINSLKDKTINLSVTHNDPKINNVMFDKSSGNIRCVIDLDTVMPGSYLYDVGDALRSLLTGENEDSKDLSLINVDFEIYKNYIKGYLSEMKYVLNDKEISLIGFSVFLLSMELGMRFLEDYIRGDIYFHTKYPSHNLIRARTQIHLAKLIYDNLDKLNAITSEVIKSV